MKTERLTLRRFTGDDVDRLFELNSDPEVMRYLTGGKPTPREVIRDEVIPFHLAVYQRLTGWVPGRPSRARDRQGLRRPGR
jgi:RimJ/RimL family protein N-acetyltransferase